MAARVLRRADLRTELGGTGALRAVVRRGEWVRVLRGVYAEGPEVPDVEVRARAAQLVLPPGALVGGRSVLWLCGVDVLPPGPPVLEVVVQRGTRVPDRAGVCARQGLLDPEDVGAVRGVPAVRPVRAAVDSARRLPLPDAVAVLDAVQRAGLTDHAGLVAELDRHGGLRGVRPARRAVDLSDRRAESPPESRLRVYLVVGGLLPAVQYDVREAGTWLARVDLAFPDLRVALEYDGQEAHTGSAAFVRDRARQNALVAAGWTVLRFTAADLHRPGALVADVRAVLAACAAR